MHRNYRLLKSNSQNKKGNNTKNRKNKSKLNNTKRLLFTLKS